MILINRNGRVPSEIEHQIREGASSLLDSYFWPDELIAETPEASDLIEMVEAVSPLLAAMLESYGRPIGANEFVIWVTHSSSSSSRYFHVTPPNAPPIHLILLDLRIYYEVASVLFVSPIGHDRPDADIASSLLQIALASRLASRQDPTLERFVLGLVAKAPIYKTTRDANEALPPSFEKLIKSSGLGAADIHLLGAAIVLFVLSHEFAHLAFKLAPNIREMYATNVAAAIKALSKDRAHSEQHDKEEKDFVKRHTSCDAAAGFLHTDMLSELATKEDEIERQLSEADREEVMADLFAIDSTSQILFEGNDRLNGDTIDLFRESLSTLWFINWRLTSSIRLALHSDEHVSIEMRPGTQSERISQQQDNFGHMQARAERLNQSFNARQRMCSQWLDVAMFTRMKDNAFKGASGRTISSVLTGGYHFPFLWRRFMIDLQLSFIQPEDQFSMLVLSSRGRALQGLFAPNSSTATLRKDADPFAFYLFGQSPLTDN
ncbi:hypothetical protein KQX62_17995 [Rhodopseudomonas palustris]|uniref:Peptidase M48 domain-containing protein n=1 Tax=Rhodopseudomonas palustris TaxID=1076 RepID=A0AAX3DUR3_RHOPL|nr:hypothetical protein [Rhodopseudomonas palustris]UYO38592.1 hypothetical protein KQX62_17995 [Rhodopseudomonas palustris]